MGRLTLVFPFAATLILALPAPARGSPGPDLRRCDEELARGPDQEGPASCLYRLAEGAGPLKTAALLRLRELSAAYPGNPWFPLYLGRIKWQTRDPEEVREAEGLYRTAAALAARRRLPEAEFQALWSLCRILRDSGRLAEADNETARAVQAARSSGSPLLALRADILQAMQWNARGEFDQAFLGLRRIEEAIAAEASYPLAREHLFTLAKAAQQTGRFQETRRAFRHAAENAARAGDREWEARALYGMAAVTLEEAWETPSASGRRKVLDLARDALRAARAARIQEAQPLWILGSLDTPDAAKGHLQRCFEVAVTAWEKSFCRSALAQRIASRQPRTAAAAIHEALALAHESGHAQARTASWSQQLRVSWMVSPPERALKTSWTALDAIEALRDQQGTTAGQPGLFSTWAEHYYWLSGRLLEAGRPDAAFEVIERMRSRTLADALGLSRSEIPPALRVRRADVFLDIARVQRRLQDENLGPRERAGARAELDRLELEASALQSQIARVDPALRRPAFASLEQVRQALALDEALLSFQIAPWKDLAGDFGGGSWLLVSTRKATRVHRLPGRTELRPAITSFLGLFEARDGSEARGASVLHRKLLAAALAELPADVRRLTIVPDDFVHRLPFAALRPEPDGEPLATRYEIALAPSATLWLHWRRARPAPAATSALVLADPVTLVTRGDAAGERSGTVLTPVRLGKLPFARTEGKSVVRHLGGGELLVGKQASESYLKGTGAGPHGLLHFAAHAVTDALNPERSGVYLSPGDPREDGLLQAREIVDLGLEGRIVVLSACESASGEIVRGEGVMGLARAFFQAGAHTVVASLWPLRDDDGAALFDRFYRHLGGGRSVAAALQAAQRDRMEAGAPAAAWAGVVVLGDGGRVPVPGGRGPGPIPWLLALGLIVVLAAALLIRLRAFADRS